MGNSSEQLAGKPFFVEPESLFVWKRVGMLLVCCLGFFYEKASPQLKLLVSFTVQICTLKEYTVRVRDCDVGFRF